MPNIYWNQIKTILEPGLGCMENFTIATDEGVFTANLDYYETVKRLHKVIAAALNGWARQADGQWKMPIEQTKPNAMPPGNPLPVEDVDKFLTWVTDGMPESAAVA